MQLLIGQESSAATTCRSTQWKAENKTYSVCYSEKLKAVISASCLEDASCGARQFLERVTDLVLKAPREQGTQNPGSIYCKWLNGVVIIGHNERGSQNAFCQAKDQTVVDLAVLANRSPSRK